MEELEGKIRDLQQVAREIEQQAIKRMDAADQRRSETKERQKLLDEKLAQYFEGDEAQRYGEIASKYQTAQAELKQVPPPEYLLSLAKCDPRPEQMHVMLRGNPHALGDPVEPCFPELFWNGSAGDS